MTEVIKEMDMNSTLEQRQERRALTKVIKRTIDCLRSDGTTRLDPDWITFLVLRMHGSPEGEDGDFWLLCAREAVRCEVRRQLSRYEFEPASGFERLQTWYLVSQGNRYEAVRVDEISDREWDDKEAELIAMGNGCFQHVYEIQRYRSQRQGEANESVPGFDRLPRDVPFYSGKKIKYISALNATKAHLASAKELIRDGKLWFSTARQGELDRMWDLIDATGAETFHDAVVALAEAETQHADALEAWDDARGAVGRVG